MKKSLFLILLITNIIGFAQTKISQQLNERISVMTPSEKTPVVIMLNAQYDSQKLNAETRLVRTEMRRDYVTRKLMAYAEAEQKEIKVFLAEAEHNNEVSEITPLWLVNAICCKATPQLIEELAARSDVKIVDDDSFRIMVDDEDETTRPVPTRGLAWNVSKVHASQVWQMGYTGSGIVVAIVDSGVNYNHTDISSNMWSNANGYCGYDFVNADNYPMDDHGHGSHCAGTVAGIGTNGTQTGMAPNAKIMAVKVLRADGGGNMNTIIQGVQYALNNGADIISCSFGVNGGSVAYSDRQLYENILAAGVIVAKSAGNNGSNLSTYPVPNNVSSPAQCPPPWLHPDQSNYQNGGTTAMMVIGSTNNRDLKGSSSSIGPVTWQDNVYYNDYLYTEGSSTKIGLIRPDVAAPGVSIVSLAYDSNTDYATKSGTSMATPCAAGVMALMMEANPNITPAQIDKALEMTAVKCAGIAKKNNYYGSGRIDAYAATRYALALADGFGAPTLSVTTSGYNNNLQWNTVSGAVHYEVYRDNAIVSTTTSNTYSDNGTQTIGKHIYHVVAVKNTDIATTSNSVATTIELDPDANGISLTANANNNDAVLTWENLSSTGDATLQYGDAETPSSSSWWGGENSYFGQKYDAAMIGQYAGRTISSISVYVKSGTYTLTLYSGSNSYGNGTLSSNAYHTTSFTASSTGWQEVSINKALPYLKDLWVVVTAPDGMTYPAAPSIYEGEGCAALYSNSLGSWTVASNRAWLMRVNLVGTNSTSTTYNLYRNGSIIAQNLSTMTYTDSNLTAGSYTYFVRATNNGTETGIQSNEATIVISAPAVSITTPEAICEGNALNLTTPSTPSGYDKGWQISSDQSFSNPQTYSNEPLDHSKNGWYLRFYIASGNNYSYSNSVQITVNETYATNFSAETCNEYVWNNITYNTQGAHTQEFTSTKGCDSIVTLNLTINEAETAEPEIVSTCGSYTWHDKTFTESGTYHDTTLTDQGCKLYETLELTIIGTLTGSHSISACESHVWNNVTYYNSGNYTQQFTTTQGCDSIETLHLTINHNETAEPEVVSSCESYTWHGKTFSESGTYRDTTETEHGCERYETLELTINQPKTNDIILASCGAYTWNGITYNTSGTYTQTFPATNGCDSIVTLHLTINGSATGPCEIVFTLRDSYGDGWNNAKLTVSFDDGSDSQILTFPKSPNYVPVTNKCDTVKVHTLNIANGTTATVVFNGGSSDSECFFRIDYADGENIFSCNKGSLSGQSGHTITTFTTDCGSGGDVPSGITAYEFSASDCEMHTWNDTTYTASGDYTIHFETGQGCDSVVTMHLSIYHSETATPEIVSSCESYTWHGKVFTESGTYRDTTETEHSCDKYETLILTISNNVVENPEFVSACESYQWHDSTYTQSGTYQYTTDLETGCTKTETLQLTINNETVAPVTVSACEEYEWYDSTYTTSGTYTAEIPLEAGCTRTETLYLTINHADDVTLEPVTTCDSYEWHGTTYTNSDVLTYETSDANGCTYTETLNLTINHADDVTLEPVTTCDSYEWHGTTYTNSGVLTYEATDANGCTYTETLNLTINHADDVTLEPITTCNSYEWHGTTYTNSDVLTYEATDANGCTYTETLNLTINHADDVTLEPVTACNSYEWHGTTYTNSDVLTYEATDTNGCTYTETLNLTINHADDVTLEPVTTCDSYEWYGQTITSSQVLTHEATAANGCTYTETLNLTINHADDVTLEPVTTCDSYEWHGTTYTNSDVLTYETSDANGCTYTETLNLTINHAEDATIEGDNIIAIGEEVTLTASEGASYEWSNGETTQSITVAPIVNTTYTVTITDVNGCIATAEITVNVIDNLSEAYNNVTIRPNPTHSTITIEGEGFEHIEVIDTWGQVIIRTIYAKVNITTINLDKMPAAVYYVKVSSTNGSSIHKVIKR